jgi:hypothetical protein
VVSRRCAPFCLAVWLLRCRLTILGLCLGLCITVLPRAHMDLVEQPIQPELLPLYTHTTTNSGLHDSSSAPWPLPNAAEISGGGTNRGWCAFALLMCYYSMTFPVCCLQEMAASPLCTARCYSSCGDCHQLGVATCYRGLSFAF